MKARNAFTLVELVIVILILGILAAIAVPRLFNTSATAVDNGVKQTLGTVRDAIELYAADNAKLPGQGATPDLPADLAPYIRGPFPNCPVGNSADPDGVKYSTGTTAFIGEATPTSKGWHYKQDTGEFIINYSGLSSVAPTVSYDKF